MSGRKPWWRRWFGTRSERAAAAYLRRQGMRVVARNVAVPPYGELDVIALEGRTVVFVEVRSTEDDDTSGPAASIDGRKQEKLTRAALAWLKKKGLLEYGSRFDALLISWPEGREPAIEHVRQAFEAVGRWQMYS